MFANTLSVLRVTRHRPKRDGIARPWRGRRFLTAARHVSGSAAPEATAP